MAASFRWKRMCACTENTLNSKHLSPWITNEMTKAFKGSRVATFSRFWELNIKGWKQKSFTCVFIISTLKLFALPHWKKHTCVQAGVTSNFMTHLPSSFWCQTMWNFIILKNTLQNSLCLQKRWPWSWWWMAVWCGLTHKCPTLSSVL